MVIFCLSGIEIILHNRVVGKLNSGYIAALELERELSREFQAEGSVRRTAAFPGVGKVGDVLSTKSNKLMDILGTIMDEVKGFY